MDVQSIQKLLKSFSEENIEFDDPHVTERLIENNMTKDKIIDFILNQTNKIHNVIEDRSKVYKLYFKLTEKRQLKVILDNIKHGKIMIRTIKILDRKLYKKIKTIKRNGRYR